LPTLRIYSCVTRYSCQQVALAPVTASIGNHPGFRL
jgi:hypothetical protein